MLLTKHRAVDVGCGEFVGVQLRGRLRCGQLDSGVTFGGGGLGFWR